MASRLSRFLALCSCLAAAGVFFAAAPASAQDCANWHRVGTGPILVDMVYDPVRNVNVAISVANDALVTWEYDGAQWLRRDATSFEALDPRFFEFKLAQDATRGVTILLGITIDSLTSDVVGSQTWEWNGRTWRLRNRDGVLPLRGFALTHDDNRGVAVLFDGGYPTGTASSTWEWNGATWSLRPVISPSRRTYPGMTYDDNRGVVVLFGGSAGSSYFGDTWEYNGTSWSRRATTGPSPRRRSGMTFDAQRGVTVLSGGLSSVAQQDTWEWNGGTWIRSPLTGWKSPLVYDTVRGVLVGIVSNTTQSEIWQYPCTVGCLTESQPPLDVLPGIRQNRYLVFRPPTSCAGEPMGVRITFTSMPGANNACLMPNFSAKQGVVMWVGPEVLVNGTTRTGVFELQPTPRFANWVDVAGAIVHVSDCNIVPCSTFTVDAVAQSRYPTGPYSAPLVLSTCPRWGDIVGEEFVNGAWWVPDGRVNALDVAAALDIFRSAPGAGTRSRADLDGDRPTQGVSLGINGLDINAVISAFRGTRYPYAGPTAPAACPVPPVSP